MPTPPRRARRSSICCAYYKASFYPAVRTLLESIYFLTVDEEIYMVRNLLDHDFTPYAMLVLGLEKSEAMRLN